MKGLDNLIGKRGFLKIYHQQRANLDNYDQHVEFIFGENNNYHQIGNGYLHYEITIRKADNTDFVNILTISLVNNAFAFCFKEARLSTTRCSDFEHNKYVGQVPTIMRALTSKGGELITHFDKNDKTQAETGNTSLPHMLINNHDIATKKK